MRNVFYVDGLRLIKTEYYRIIQWRGHILPLSPQRWDWLAALCATPRKLVRWDRLRSMISLPGHEWVSRGHVVTVKRDTLRIIAAIGCRPQVETVRGLGMLLICVR